MEMYSNIKVKFIPRVFENQTIRGSVTTIDNNEKKNIYSFKIYKTDVSPLVNFSDEKPQYLDVIKQRILTEYKPVR